MTNFLKVVTTIFLIYLSGMAITLLVSNTKNNESTSLDEVLPNYDFAFTHERQVTTTRSIMDVLKNTMIKDVSGMSLLFYL